MATVVASAGTIASATGYAWQSHLIYDGTRWWCFYVDTTNADQIKTQYSSDLSSWSAGAALSGPENLLADAANIGVTHKTISGTIVVHVTFSTTLSTCSLYRIRATISGTTLTWGSWTLIDQQFDAAMNPTGAGVGISSTDLVYFNHGPNDGNARTTRSTDADTGSAGPTTWQSLELVGTATWYYNGGAVLPLASGEMLYVGEDAMQSEPSSYTNTRWSRWTTSWSALTDIFTSDLGGGVSPNNWGVIRRTDTDIHCVQRSGADTYIHRRFDGTNWSDGHSISTQASVAGSGVFLATDGTSVWLFVIADDAANAVKYSLWGGSSWGSWTTLEGSTKVRRYITGSPAAGGGKIGVLWTETNGANYDVVAASLTIAGGASNITGTTSVAFDATGSLLAPIPVARGPLWRVRRWPNRIPREAVVDHSHPHARGLVAAWVMREGGGLSVYDVSGRGNTATLSGSPLPSWVTTPRGSALNFANNASYLDCGNVASPTTEMTIVCWFRASSLAGGLYRPFVNKEQSGTRWWWFGVSPTNRLYSEVRLVTANVPLNGVTTLSADTLYMAALRYTGDTAAEGTKMELYLDGRLEVSGIPSAGPISATGTNVWIGSFSVNGFLGDIIDVRIHNVALSASVLTDLYVNRTGVFVDRVSARRVTAADPTPAPPPSVPGVGSTSLLLGVG